MKSISNPKALKNQDNTPKYSEMEYVGISEKAAAKIRMKLKQLVEIEYLLHAEKNLQIKNVKNR